ncbi:PLP-dependent aminotransferase family protein [Geothrix sp. PMB-07]|uniref:MocR-like pyridoxine biosynthesis transcription factor PdxR n=1 Tax=Geothrix sp. PMB-07 TaxID=3068640 RepID=UPI0027419E3A|nr:PLP-dependent aminotransferase family protein [Geothrix sp. PMB-07]WLT31054.1 PLP-dependent aminotransferase family protein [Geothrix sp. PMB-07]
MRPWTFPIALQGPSEAGARDPLFQQIAQAIRSDIRRGRLKPGDALPGSRSLAQTLGVHRNTVLAAYRELEAEGWTTTGQRATHVAADLPEAPARRGRREQGPGYDLEMPHPAPARLSLRDAPPHRLLFGGGLPDLRLVPTDLLARAYRRALKVPSLLGYGDARGEPRLRTALAHLLSETRGLSVSAEQVLVASGSQGALDLVARNLLKPGDRVAVEDPGYPAAWATLRASGATLLPLPVDAAGLRVEALEAALREGPVRAIYLTPHHQFPTTVTMNAARRLRLLEVARRHRIALLEDDYDNEFHYEGRPVLPLASNDPGGVVIYLGTLSKILAPGLRIGFLTGPQALINALGARRAASEGQGDHAIQRVAAELLEDGLLQRHARKMRRTYLARRGTLAASLEKHLHGVVHFEVPPGGMSLWLQVDPGLDADRWAERAERQGVTIYTGRRFDFRGQARPNLRLGFSSLNERELEEAVGRLARALP